MTANRLEEEYFSRLIFQTSRIGKNFRKHVLANFDAEEGSAFQVVLSAFANPIFETIHFLKTRIKFSKFFWFGETRKLTAF